MIVGSIRSGLVEAVHPVAVAAVDAAGTVVAFFRRGRGPRVLSAIGPQADSGRHIGATRRQSRDGAVGNRWCQPSWPTSPRRVCRTDAARGGTPRPVISVVPPDRPGKRGCRPAVGVARPVGARDGVSQLLWEARCDAAPVWLADWSLEYTALDHPLHGLVAGYAAEVMGRAVTPVGIDGCGVPTLRSDVVGLRGRSPTLRSIRTSPTCGVRQCATPR